MATCKDCVHFEPCREYGNILDPCGGGVVCDCFKSKADVQEVVRCKDCKHSNEVGTICRYSVGRTVEPEHFCSYGEKEE